VNQSGGISAELHHPFPPERYLAYLTTTDVHALPKDEAVVVVNVASVEQHGPHLPLVTDSLIGQRLLALALERLDPSAQVWVLPPLPYGKSNEHRRFVGTMTLSQTTLAAVLHELAESVARAGFRRLVLLNSHGGNPAVLDHVARDARESTGLMVFPLTVFRMGLDYGHVHEREERWGTHAGEWETSLMLALAPELVRFERTAELGSYPAFEAEVAHVSALGPVTFAWLSEDLSTSGTMGDPRAATPERGQRIVDQTVAKLADVLAEIARFEMPTPAGAEERSTGA
jgi:creatinine amidohydrolase